MSLLSAKEIMEIIKKVSEKTMIPVVAHGGAGCEKDIKEKFICRKDPMILFFHILCFFPQFCI
mgnify:CR=1 FL=1